MSGPSESARLAAEHEAEELRRQEIWEANAARRAQAQRDRIPVEAELERIEAEREVLLERRRALRRIASE